jgi:hypothetical protein
MYSFDSMLMTPWGIFPKDDNEEGAKGQAGNEGRINILGRTIIVTVGTDHRGDGGTDVTREQHLALYISSGAIDFLVLTGTDAMKLAPTTSIAPAIMFQVMVSKRKTTLNTSPKRTSMYAMALF